MFDFRPIFFVVGLLLTTLAVAMCAPLVVDAAAGDDEWRVFAGSAALTAFIGVTMILTGVDATGPRVMTTDPSGAYRAFKAIAVGRKNDDANKILEDQYTDDIMLEGAIKLAILAIKTASGSGMTKDSVKVSVIPADTKVFKRLTAEEIEGYLS